MERKWWTLIAVSIAIFMLLLDITVVNVALPSIQRALHSSFADLQWVVNAYALTLAAFLLTSGAVADLIGRRRVFVAGLVVFTCSSAVCGLSGTPLVLNLARAVQGTGGAMMYATSLALIAQAFHGRDRGVAFGVFGAVTGAAVAIGPVIGGIITTGIGWQWIFFVNVPIGIAAVILTLAKVADSRDPNATGVDWVGLVTFSGALFLLGFALIQGNEYGWGSTRIVGFFAGAALLLVAFVIAERRQARPMLDLTLFRRPAFTGASIVAFSLSASIFAMFLYLTLYIQDVLGYDALQAGLRFLPITLLSFIVAPIAGRLSVRMPVRLLLGGGLLLVSGSLVAMTAVTASSILDRADPRLHHRRRRHRHDQPTARLDRDRRRALLAQRHGLGHQQHLPPGRHRDRHRGPRRDLRARGAQQHDLQPDRRRATTCRIGSGARAAQNPARLGRSEQALPRPPPRRERGPRALLPGGIRRRLPHHPARRRGNRAGGRHPGAGAGAQPRLRQLQPPGHRRGPARRARVRAGRGRRGMRRAGEAWLRQGIDPTTTTTSGQPDEHRTGEQARPMRPKQRINRPVTHIRGSRAQAAGDIAGRRDPHANVRTAGTSSLACSARPACACNSRTTLAGPAAAGMART